MHIYNKGLRLVLDASDVHAIVHSAGGEVVNKKTQFPLKCKTKDLLLNPYFLYCNQSENGP